MASADGIASEYTGEQIDMHVGQCENCCRELAQMQNVDHLFKRQTRMEQAGDLWSVIDKRIGDSTASQIGWRPFALLATLLAAYKLLELLPARDPGFSFKLVPLVLVIALFALIKENPFKINTGLILEK